MVVPNILASILKLLNWELINCLFSLFTGNKLFSDLQNSISVDQKLRHDIPRHQITQVYIQLLFDFPASF